MATLNDLLVESRTLIVEPEGPSRAVHQGARGCGGGAAPPRPRGRGASHAQAHRSDRRSAAACATSFRKPPASKRDARPMDESLRAQIDTYLPHLDGLDPPRTSASRHAGSRSLQRVSARGDSRLAARLRRNNQSIVRRQQGPLARPIVQRSLPDALDSRPRRRRRGAGTRSSAGWSTSSSKPLPRCPEWMMAMPIPHLPRRRRSLGGSISFTTPSFGLSSSRRTPTAGGPSSTADMTSRCSLPAESWRPS